MRRSATRLRGYFCRNASSFCTLPVEMSSRIFLGGALPTLDLLELLGAQPPEIGRVRGDRHRGVFVSPHPERLRVAFVEKRELGELAEHVQNVLLGVGHLPGLPKSGRGRGLVPWDVADHAEAEVLSIAGRDVRVTHPTSRISRKKRGSPSSTWSVLPGGRRRALRGIRDRPIVLKRFVNGAEAPPFYQKRAPESRPEWLRTVTLASPSGRTAEEVVVDDAAGLAWVVNLGCLELHPHPVLVGDLEHPNELRVDLDPGPGVAWSRTCAA